MAKVDLSKVSARETLRSNANAEPHWERVRPGVFIGFAPSASEGAGTWSARVWDEDASRYRKKALGAFGDLLPNARFAVAKASVEAFATMVERGGVAETKLETVADACRDYAKDRAEIDKRFERLVYEDPIAKVKLDKLRRRHLIDWQDRVVAKPALVSRSKGDEQRTRPRAPTTVNRDMAALRAALNKVLAHGTPGSEAAWQEGLATIRGATRRRDLYLDRKQRLKLLENVGEEAKPFVRALCLLPVRPGAIGALIAANFNKRTGELTIAKDKAGEGRRITLPTDAAALFSAQAAGKLPGAPLFMRNNGKPWDKESWKKPIAKAVAAAGLPKGATAYTLRHSTITDLVMAGPPLLTIAQIAGTSIEMIQQHYGHLTGDASADALAALSL